MERLITTVWTFATFFEKNIRKIRAAACGYRTVLVLKKIDRLIFLKEKHQTVTETVTEMWYNNFILSSKTKI